MASIAYIRTCYFILTYVFSNYNVVTLVYTLYPIYSMCIYIDYPILGKFYIVGKRKAIATAMA